MSHGQTQERILDAALELWREGGFSAVTTRAVALRAGVNEVTLFRHFVCKEKLLQAMVERAAPKEPPDFKVAEAEARDLEEELYLWAGAFLDQMVPVGDAILFGLAEALASPALASVCMEAPIRVRQNLVARLQRLQIAGRIAAGPYEDVADLFFASLFTHAITNKLRGGEDLNHLAKASAHVFAASLRCDTSSEVAGGTVNAD